MSPSVTTAVAGPSTDFTRTNVVVDLVVNSHTVTAALARLVTAHTSDIRVKNWRTSGCCLVAWSNGITSNANRWASGLPNGTEIMKATPTSAVVIVGCRKYTNIEPVAMAAMVRAVS